MKRYAYGSYPDLSGVKKVLVVVLKNIGDVVLSSPVFGTIRQAIPDATVDAFVNIGTEEVLAGNPDIGKVHVLNRKELKGSLRKLKEELRLFRAIRSSGYDMVITLSTGERSRNIALFSGAKLRVGAQTRKKAFLGLFPFITIPVPMAPANRHYVERNLDNLRRLGIFPPKDKKRTVFYEGEEARARMEKLLPRAGLAKGDDYVVVHPTSRWMFKCLPPANVATLIDRIQKELPVKVVLTSGPGRTEKEYIEEMRSTLTTDVVDLTAILSLRELGAVIRGARLFFGVDSAPMHISAAVDTPAVAVFGPSSSTDWGPWGKGHLVITSPEHSCVPCGRDGCGGSKVSDCLREMDVRMVFDLLAERVNKDASGTD